jgi:chaperonin GroEL
VIANEVLESPDYAWGFDAQTSTHKDLVAAGVIDPTKVVRVALQHAASIAGLMITTEAVVGEYVDAKGRDTDASGGDMRDRS